MEHNLKISVSKKPMIADIASIRNVSIRERLLNLFLGNKQRVTIIVPGDSVRELAISEAKEEGGVFNGQNERT